MAAHHPLREEVVVVEEVLVEAWCFPRLLLVLTCSRTRESTRVEKREREKREKREKKEKKETPEGK